MKFIVIFCLFVALSVSAVAQENNDSTNLEDIEGVEQAVQSSTSPFVKSSSNFIETPYFTLLLGLAPYIPTVVVATPVILTLGLFLLAADAGYIDALRSVNHFSANVTAITLPIGLIASYIVNIQYASPSLMYYVYPSALPGYGERDAFVTFFSEIINTSLFFLTGVLWASLVNNSDDIDFEISNHDDFLIIAATVTGGLYLATSITRGIIASFQSEIGTNLTTGDIAKHWRVVPTISGIEAVYSY